MPSKGTIENLLLSLSAVLQELQFQAQGGNAKNFLQQFGILIDDSQETQLAAVLNSITGASLNTVLAAKRLKDAIDAEDIELILSTGKEIINEIKTTVDLFHQLKDELISLGIPSVQVSDLPQHLFNFLVVTFLDRTPGISPLLEFLGILEVTSFNIESEDPVNPPYFIYSFRFDNLAAWLTNGSDQLKNMYGWGADNFDGSLLFPRTEKFLSSFGLPVIYDSEEQNWTLYWQR